MKITLSSTLLSTRQLRRPLTVYTLVLLLIAAVRTASAWAAEPMVGTWMLTRQEINGEEAKAAPVQLSVYQIRDSLSFAFAMPVKDVYETNMGYRVLLDGTEADVKNAKGEKVGTVKMTHPSPTQYAITMGRANQPPTVGKLTVSADGKTLTSETDTVQGERTIHLLQVYTRK